MDLRAMVDEPISLGANEVELIPTGISIHINNPNIVATIHPRSGLGHKKGLVLGNLTGVIDSDYQGELMVSAWNRSGVGISIKPGERIAQLMFLPVLQVEFNIVDSFDQTDRGSNGFGSSGVL